MTDGPLAGIRILEMGNFIAGPFAGQLLADYGAEVVKIETPRTGDTMRHWGVTKDGESLWWPTIARNKRSIAIDLRTGAGQDLARKLMMATDVVIENFRPGTLKRWGLDYESVAARNERLIMVHVSGFGQTGPQADEPGFGSVGEAVGGIRFTTGDPATPASRTGISLGDSLASLFAVIGSLASLQERSISGKGQEVDVAIYESVLALMESSLADFEVGGALRRRTGAVLPGVAPSNAYPTANGVDVVIAGNADGVFSRLAVAIERPDLNKDPRFNNHQSRGQNAAQLDRLISEWTRVRSSDEVIGLLRAAQVPVGLINTAQTMLQDKHFEARDMILREVTPQGWEIPMTGIVPKFSRTPGRVGWVGPKLGEHTNEVLDQWAGITEQELDDLRSKKVI